MIDFAGYSYAEHKASIACSHVLSGAPVLIFVHDEDGDLHFMCGENGHGVDDLHVVGLVHLSEQIRSIADIPVVKSGQAAERSEPGLPWTISPVVE